MRPPAHPEERPSGQVSPSTEPPVCSDSQETGDSIVAPSGSTDPSIPAIPDDLLAVDIMTVADGAARIGVHELTVRRWISKGRIESFRIGPHSYLTRRGVEHAAANRTAIRGSTSGLQVGAVRLLAALGEAERALTVGQLSSATGFAPGTIRRHLLALQAHGLVTGGTRPAWQWEVTARGSELLDSGDEGQIGAR